MLPHSLGKEIEETLLPGLLPTPLPFSTIVTPPFFLRSILLSERREEITYLEAVLPLTALTRSLNPKALNPANSTDFKTSKVKRSGTEHLMFSAFKKKFLLPYLLGPCREEGEERDL